MHVSCQELEKDGRLREVERVNEELREREEERRKELESVVQERD